MFLLTLMQVHVRTTIKAEAVLVEAKLETVSFFAGLAMAQAASVAEVASEG